MNGSLTVLVVEDHAELSEWLRTELAHAGWRPTLARTAEEARRLVAGHAFDAVLIDIGLPDEDGIALCRCLRTRTTASILMVTARHELRDRVLALDSGADDYVEKPFAIEELLARIRAVVRRARQEPGLVLEFGDLRLWPDDRRTEVGGEGLVLSRREFDLLSALLHGPRRVHSRAQLLEAAWGYDFEGESNVVDVTIGRLRERLRRSSVEIVPVRGVGYRLQGRA